MYYFLKDSTSRMVTYQTGESTCHSSSGQGEAHRNHYGHQLYQSLGYPVFHFVIILLLYRDPHFHSHHAVQVDSDYHIFIVLMQLAV